MRNGDRDSKGTRIYAEREFREESQVLVATESAGEGINLQFCWLMMINYDIPWNPVRLEQCMGRIHRYGQEHDCLIFKMTIGDITHLGRTWVLPHPERTQFSRMVRDDEIERIAMDKAVEHERSRGWQPEDVSAEDRGFDILSRNPVSGDVRFIEVKGRAAIGEIAHTKNEYETASRLRKDFWLYVVFNCAFTPELHLIQDPVQLGWKPIVKINHYHVDAEVILQKGMKNE